MTYYCPKCEAAILHEDDGNPLPVHCPECGADLYLEEVLYQQMITEGLEVAV